MASNDQCKSANKESSGQIVSVALLVAAVILFVFLILKDAVKALKTRAHWIPADFLVLSAFSIQLLNVLSAENEELDPNVGKKICLNEFWMIHTSRIMLCVVVAYLIPGMANPGAENFWETTSNFLYRLWPRQEKNITPLYIVFATIMLFSFIMLLLLLGCANIAGRGIARIVAQKVPLIFKEEEDHHHHHHDHHSYEAVEENHHHYHYNPHCQDCWRRVEDAVLRAWIVARAYSLEYTIARSALASSCAIIVTVQIVITIVGGVRHSPDLVIDKTHEKLMFTITMLQCVFILIGWAMIEWRWLTAVAYYARWQPDTWSSCLRIEDFWTRHLRELQQAQETQLKQAQFLHNKIKKLVAEQPTKITLPSKVLYAVIALQSLTVSFSKACRLASLVLFRNTLTGWLLSLILLKHERQAFVEYPKHEEMLRGVQMLGETPRSLWVANRRSIARARQLILQGNEDGERNSDHLVGFLANKRTGSSLGLSCLDPTHPQSGLKYLCRKTQQSEEEHFTDMSTKSWKMTAVSLLTIIAQLSPISAVKDCLKAYSQAWEIIDFVDKDFVEKADTDADGITSDAADNYFLALQNRVDSDHTGLPATNLSGATPESVRAALDKLKMESKSKMELPGSINCISALGLKSKENIGGLSKGWDGSDSIDWMAAAAGSAVYKLCNSIQCNKGSDVNELLKELESSLADIINDCLEKIQHLLLLNSRKWALNSDERRMGRALYTAGKASAIMKKLESREQGGSIPK